MSATTFSTAIPQPGRPPIFDLEQDVWQEYARGNTTVAAAKKYRLRQRAFAQKVNKNWRDQE